MNLHEHHLILLMEECFEVSSELAALGQRASKQLRFGGDEIQPGQRVPNAERLRFEILDLLACVEFLERAGLISAITPKDVTAHLEFKSEKIARMLALSRERGQLIGLPQGAVSVVKARDDLRATEETGNDRPAAPISERPMTPTPPLLRCYQTIEGVTMPCYLRVGHEGPHECYPLRGPADRGPIQWVKEQGPAGHPPGTWTPEMKAKLTEKYAAARDNRTLSDLADELGVGVYQLYTQAHKLGLSRPIRRR